MAVIGVFIISLPSFFVTGNYIISEAEVPQNGVEENPFPDEKLTGGLLFVVLDGGRRDMMSDPDLMPKLNARMDEGAYLEITTNPITMTATCVKEIATGVPARPNEALDNFRPSHPGSVDGWGLLSTHDGDGDSIPDNNLAILGDYVWESLYPDRELIPFSKHRYGHADYYKGDEEAFVTLGSWLNGTLPEGSEESPDAIIAHLSGLDSVGHRYMAKSDDYREKLTWLDDHLDDAFKLVPSDWTVIVTSDHGLSDTGQHGSPDEIIRETAAWMWGPNVAEGVKVTGVTQRDLATLPSFLFGLPLPHAIHGKIPLDAFSLSQSDKDIYEQWNWNAAVERNDWYEENGLPYVEGLTEADIEWEKLPEDEIGIRNIDLTITFLSIFIISVFSFKLMTREGNSVSDSKKISAGILCLLSFSLFLSYNRSTFAFPYYNLGILPICYLAWKVFKEISPKRESIESNTSIHLLVLLLIFIIVFPETRFTIIGLVMLVYFALNNPIKNRTNENLKSTKMELYVPFMIILFIAVVFSDYRLYGVSVPRFMIFFSQTYETFEIIFSTIIIVSCTYLYSTVGNGFSPQKALAISLSFSVIPYMIAQDSNTVDWVLLTFVIIGFLAAGALRFKQNEYSTVLFYYTALFLLTMSWGAWAGGITMILFATVESFVKNEWSHLFQEKETDVREFSRMILIGLLPLGIWFTWWAALGQTDGITHPRDIDPGNLFLKGGYIGDRTSPSNFWVFLLGAGPVILIGCLWWHHFQKIGWPINLAFLILVARVAALAIQLSVSPNLPRLVFKIGWDMLLGLVIYGVMLLFILYKGYSDKKAGKTDSIFVI